jgi:hypothetical protein
MPAYPIHEHNESNKNKQGEKIRKKDTGTEV